MALNIKDVYLDFTVKDLAVINCTQYDKDSRAYNIHFLDNGKLFNISPDSQKVMFKMTKKDNTKIFNDCAINSDGTVSFILTEQICILSGVYDVQFVLFNSDDMSVVHTMPFKLNITSTVTDNKEIESSDEFNALNRMILEEKERLDDIKEFNDTMTSNEDVRKFNETQRINNEVERINAENKRKSNEVTREQQEASRESMTATAVSDAIEATVNAVTATDNAIVAANEAKIATDDLQSKLNSHHFVLVSDKNIAGGVASLDSNAKVPRNELYEATVSNKGIVQLSDSVSSTSTTTAATANAVKVTYDKTVSVDNNLSAEIARAKNMEDSITVNLDNEVKRSTDIDNTIKTDLSNEIGRAKKAETDNSNAISSEEARAILVENTISDNLSNEITRAKKAETDNNNAIAVEVARATNKENLIISDLNAEITRAKDAEKLKADINSPSFTGTPNAPTAVNGTNNTQIATTAFTQTAISNHNSSSTAHTDIRDLISGLTTRLNTLADSDDTTLDQMSEIVAYIKSNKTLIEDITTSKVNVNDIVNSLSSTATDKPLSANQGKVLNDLISTLTATVNSKADSSTVSSHISNTDVHVTAIDKANYNDANTKKHTHSNKDVLDGISAENVNKWNNNYVTKNNESDANGLLNSLGTGSSTPTDNDYYISQYVGGGTTTTSYLRRPVSALWAYIKAKTESLYAKLSHTHTKSEITDFPVIPAAVAVKGETETNYRTGNVNITKANIGLDNVGNFKAVSTAANQGLSETEKANARVNIGAGASSFSGDYNDLTNKPTIPANTWRGIQNNLTSTSTSDSLSANQGRLLANGSARDNTKLPLSGGTMTGALNLANSTWNIVGDDVQFGDRNVAGGFCIQGRNGSTNIKFIGYEDNGSVSIVYDETNKCLNFNFL